MEDLARAVEKWDSDQRLIRESGGMPLDDQRKRSILMDTQLEDLSTYVTMELGKHPTYLALKAHVLKFARATEHKKNSSMGLFAVDRASEACEMQDEAGQGCDSFDDTSPEEQVEISASMKSKGIKAPRTFRRPKTQRIRDRIRGVPGARAEPPPRGTSDMLCANCGRKGHLTADCRQPRVEFNNSPRFTCDKPGRNARICPDRPVNAATEDAPAALAPVKAVTTGDGQPLRSVFCCQWYSGAPCGDASCEDDGCAGCAAA